MAGENFPQAGSAEFIAEVRLEMEQYGGEEAVRAKMGLGAEELSQRVQFASYDGTLWEAVEGALKPPIEGQKPCPVGEKFIEEYAKNHDIRDVQKSIDLFGQLDQRFKVAFSPKTLALAETDKKKESERRVEVEAHKVLQDKKAIEPKPKSPPTQKLETKTKAVKELPPVINRIHPAQIHETLQKEVEHTVLAEATQPEVIQKPQPEISSPDLEEPIRLPSTSNKQIIKTIAKERFPKVSPEIEIESQETTALPQVIIKETPIPSIKFEQSIVPLFEASYVPVEASMESQQSEIAAPVEYQQIKVSEEAEPLIEDFAQPEIFELDYIVPVTEAFEELVLSEIDYETAETIIHDEFEAIEPAVWAEELRPIMTPEVLEVQVANLVEIMPEVVQEALAEMAAIEADPELQEVVQELMEVIAMAADRLHELAATDQLDSEEAIQIEALIIEWYDQLLTQLGLEADDTAKAVIIQRIIAQNYRVSAIDQPNSVEFDDIEHKRGVFGLPLSILSAQSLSSYMLGRFAVALVTTQ